MQRLQLALNVEDLEASIAFFSNAFGAQVTKRRPGYANFAIDNPPLKLVLFENPGAEQRINHLGVEVFDDLDIEAARQRLASGKIEHVMEQEKVCCYAPQNKVITHDREGTMWEWYRVLGDSESFFGAENQESGTFEDMPDSQRAGSSGPTACCSGSAAR